jgi:hypothetical protein
LKEVAVTPVNFCVTSNFMAILMAFEGLLDGLDDGMGVDGDAVGCPVGSIEGLLLGCPVGLDIVGMDEGFEDGCLLGCPVGRENG